MINQKYTIIKLLVLFDNIFIIVLDTTLNVDVLLSPVNIKTELIAEFRIPAGTYPTLNRFLVDTRNADTGEVITFPINHISGQNHYTFVIIGLEPGTTYHTRLRLSYSPTERNVAFKTLNAGKTNILVRWQRQRHREDWREPALPKYFSG